MGWGRSGKGETDGRTGGWTEGVRFLEAAGGPGSLDPTLRAHRQCAPRLRRTEVRAGGARGGCCLEEAHVENRRQRGLDRRSLSSPVAHPHTPRPASPYPSGSLLLLWSESFKKRRGTTSSTFFQVTLPGCPLYLLHPFWGPGPPPLAPSPASSPGSGRQAVQIQCQVLGWTLVT